MEIKKKRWIVLIAACLVNLCIGSVYAWSVFANPMTEYLNVLTGKEIHNISIVFTIVNAVGPITMITGGIINDRVGPKWLIFTGGLLFGSGMIFSGFAKSTGALIVSYGLCVGLAVGLVYGCTVSTVVKFFPDKRGLVAGIATASYGISSVLMPPVANVIINKYGIVNAFKILGIMMMLIICISSLFISGYKKNHYPVKISFEQGLETDSKDLNWKQMIHTLTFYIMLLMLCCGAFSGLMIISQASQIAQQLIGMNTTQASLAVSVLALFNTGGRILAGQAADKFGEINSLKAVYILITFGMIILSLCHKNSFVLFYIGISIIGVCFGSIMGIYPSFTAVRFGSKNNSVNYGIMFTGFALAGVIGPTIMSSINNKFGDYRLAFGVAATISILGLIMSFVLKKHIRNSQSKIAKL